VRTLLALCLSLSAVAFAQPADDSEVPGDKVKESPAGNADRDSDGDEAPPTRPRSSDRGLKLNPEGVYGGVAPGSQNLPPRAPKLPLKKGPHRLTWSGFQVKDGVPTVFLEVTGLPDYHVEQQRGALVVTLRNTVIPVKNNRRPLRVEAFNTAVQTIEAAGRGRDTRVTIHYKDAVSHAVSHTERVEPAAGGFQMLVIELPK
jgi:hypothetical protein